VKGGEMTQTLYALMNKRKKTCILGPLQIVFFIKATMAFPKKKKKKKSQNQLLQNSGNQSKVHSYLGKHLYRKDSWILARTWSLWPCDMLCPVPSPQHHSFPWSQHYMIMTETCDQFLLEGTKQGWSFFHASFFETPPDLACLLITGKPYL
jgi:hypothetical protein